MEAITSKLPLMFANHVSASGSAVFPDASSATTSTRFLHQNGASSKVWKPTVNLTGIAAHTGNPTGKYNHNDVVKGATDYYKASANWSNVTNHTWWRCIEFRQFKSGT